MFPTSVRARVRSDSSGFTYTFFDSSSLRRRRLVFCNANSRQIYPVKLAVNLPLNVLPARYQLFRRSSFPRISFTRELQLPPTVSPAISATFPDLAEIYLPTNRCLPPSSPFHRLFSSCSSSLPLCPGLLLTMIYISPSAAALKSSYHLRKDLRPPSTGCSTALQPCPCATLLLSSAIAQSLLSRASIRYLSVPSTSFYRVS